MENSLLSTKELLLWKKRLNQRFDGIDRELAAIRHQLSQAVYQHEFDILERRVEVLERKAGIQQ